VSLPKSPRKTVGSVSNNPKLLRNSFCFSLAGFY
jgi:hypothetical protein